MSENNPPLTTSTTTATATAPSDINTRGIPYYEKLKRDLRETLQRKRLLDKNMATLEDQIYRFEAAYLEETSSAGNIIRGFDNYIKGSALLGSSSGGGGAAAGGVGGGAGVGGGGGGGGTSTRRKGVTEQDRVFSRSSCSFMRVRCFVSLSLSLSLTLLLPYSTTSNWRDWRKEGRTLTSLDRKLRPRRVSRAHLLTHRRLRPGCRHRRQRERAMGRRQRAR